MFWKRKPPSPKTAPSQVRPSGPFDLWFETADGVRIHLRDRPARGVADTASLPVLCLHGLTRNVRDFDDIADAVANRGRRVIAVSMRGRGRSEPDPEPGRYHPGTYANDVIGLLGALGIPRAHFLGTSMGGLITMVVSARRPDLLASAILNDIGPDIDPKGLERIKGYVGGAAVIETWDDAAAYARKINGEAFPTETAPAFWLAFARRIFREGGDGRPVLDYDPAISGAVKAGNVVSEPPWTAFAGLGPVPTLVIRGALSDILSADIVGRMRAKKADLAEAVVPDVGHAPLLTEPVAAAAIHDWLARRP